MKPNYAIDRLDIDHYKLTIYYPISNEVTIHHNIKTIIAKILETEGDVTD